MSKTQGGGLIREQFPPNRYSKESKEKWRKLSRKPVVVWSFLQKLRGFKLICKHYFMYKVTNKLYYNKNESTHYDGLNKQLKLLGKIKPKCVLSRGGHRLILELI